MRLQVTGLHMEVGESLREHCEEKAQGLKKYFDQVIEVDVNFSKPTHEHKAEVSVHASGIHLRAVGLGTDHYTSMDDATQKLERQLSKYKGRMKKHRNRREAATAERMAAFAPISTTTHTVEEESLDSAPDDMFAEYMPKIVHKDVKEIQTLTVDEAVMQMDLLHTNFFIFQNPISGELNVVYREPNGTIGWVEPDAKKLVAAKAS